MADYWDRKLSKLEVSTPDPDMDVMLNTWMLYQSEINVMFSRFASFIEVGGRTGLGYRDTAQDAMTIPHSNPEGRIHLETGVKENGSIFSHPNPWAWCAEAMPGRGGRAMHGGGAGGAHSPHHVCRALL